MEVRTADTEEVPDVLTILDSALLATDSEAVRAAVDRDDLLVADADGRILGACLLVGAEVDAIAVRPGRRGQGVGTALVAAAVDRRERLIAEFHARVRPFWASLDFEIEPAEEPERYRGIRERPPARVAHSPLCRYYQT